MEKTDSIRERVMSELGITSDDAQALINGYARNNGHVDEEAIISSTRRMVKEIVTSLPYQDVDYSFAHEVLHCGKDREREAIAQTSWPSYSEECLPSDSVDDTYAWSMAVYHAAQSEYETRVMGNGIEGFRLYARTLPFDGHSLNYAAEQLSEAENTADFIAKNGTREDFALLMTEEIKDGDGTRVRRCPRAVSDMVYEAVRKNGGERFNRRTIIQNMAAIHQSKAMDEEEKKEVQEAYLTAELTGRLPECFYNMVKEGEGKDVLLSTVDILSKIPNANIEGLRGDLLRDVANAFDNGILESERAEILFDSRGLSAGNISTLAEMALGEYCDENGKRAITNSDLRIIRDEMKDGAFACLQRVFSKEEALSLELSYGPISDRAYDVAWVKDPATARSYIEMSDEETDAVKKLRHMFSTRGITFENAICLVHKYGPIEDEDRASTLVGCFQAGLPENAIKACVDPSLNEEQRYQIANGFTQGFDMTPYANGKYDWDQLKEVILGFKGGLTKEQIDIYAEPRNFSVEQMEKIRKSLEKGLSNEQAALLANPSLSTWQMDDILTGFKLGLTLEQVSVYARPEFNKRYSYIGGLDDQGDSQYWYETQAKVIIRGFTHGLSFAQVNLYARPELSYEQMSEIERGLEEGLSIEQVSLYAKPEFNKLQMSVIREGFEKDFSMEQVSVYADPEFNWNQMEQIYEGFEYGLSIEQVSLYANPELDKLQMEQIRLGLEHGLSIEQVSFYADPDFYWFQMEEMRKSLEGQNTHTDPLDGMIEDAKKECLSDKDKQNGAVGQTEPGDNGAI